MMGSLLLLCFEEPKITRPKEIVIADIGYVVEHILKEKIEEDQVMWLCDDLLIEKLEKEKVKVEVKSLSYEVKLSALKYYFLSKKLAKMI